LKKEKKNWKLEELEPNTLYDNDEADIDIYKKQESTQNNSR